MSMSARPGLRLADGQLYVPVCGLRVTGNHGDVVFADGFHPGMEMPNASNQALWHIAFPLSVISKVRSQDIAMIKALAALK